MTFTLTTPREAESLIARMFIDRAKCSIQVREERAFKANGWLNFGSVSLRSLGGEPGQLMAAVKRGSFEWAVPSLNEVKANLVILLDLEEELKENPKVRRALDAMASISVRAGLQHPKFDPYAFEAMPFRRSMTVVADTSGALQGGLDFVARYLHPAARVKVPAIVQMEIVNFADRFLSGRRASKTRPAALLIDHLMSQGGQRVLLRLELQAETEIERTFLLGDPLRSAFQSDADPEVRELNLSIPIRGYADRLILESARQHRAQSNHGHQVQLLTSDQGLARMAMGEGIVPLFFDSVRAEDMFGRTLTGATLNPFTGSLTETSLTALLWELATAFGSVKLVNADGSHSFHVAAIGENLSWSPYQSQADLLWCDLDNVPSWPNSQTKPSSQDADQSKPIDSAGGKSDAPILARHPKKRSKDAAKAANQTEKPASSARPLRTKKGTSSVSLPRINVGVLFSIVDELDNSQGMSIDEVVEVAGVKGKAALDDYRRFLVSGEMVDVSEGSWSPTKSGQELAIALRQEDIVRVRDLLLAFPAYRLLTKRIGNLETGQTWEPLEFTRSLTTFRTFAECTNLAAQIAGEGIYPTLNKPSAEEFASVALDRFRELDRGDELVSTGAWLEALVRTNGIHPEIARSRLNDASAKGLLKRSTEGSTTDTRLDKHAFHALRVVSGRPEIKLIHLYRGDYLIPGKSSSSLRIQGPSS